MLSILILFRALALAPAARWSKMYVRYAGSGPIAKLEPPYTKKDDSRTYLHIEYTPGQLSGVYIYAHGNGGNADIQEYHRSSVTAAGYAFISWESVAPMTADPEDAQRCFDDHRLVMQWVVANAQQYSLDLSNVVMGGRSRGSICSWPLAHDRDDAYTITGIYMYGALPCESCMENFLSYVKAESPPLLFVYAPECPKPIQQDCITSPTPYDVHNPKNGQKIVDKYYELGLGSLVNLKDGQTNDGIRNILCYFPSFVNSLNINSVHTMSFEAPDTCRTGDGSVEKDSCKKALEDAGCLNRLDCEVCAQSIRTNLVNAGCVSGAPKQHCKQAAIFAPEPTETAPEPTETAETTGTPNAVEGGGNGSTTDKDNSSTTRSLQLTSLSLLTLLLAAGLESGSNGKRE